MVCPHTDKGRSGIKLVRTFFGQGRKELIFRDFLRTSFINGP